MSYIIHQHYNYDDNYWVFTDRTNVINFFKELINKMIEYEQINQEVYGEIYGELPVEEINQKVLDEVENCPLESKIIIYNGYINITKLNDEGHGRIS
jgi:hypothetical protein